MRRWTAAAIVGVLAAGLGLAPAPAQAAGVVHGLYARQHLGFTGTDPACADFTEAALAAKGGTEPGFRSLPADGVTRVLRMASTRQTSTRYARANAVVQGRGSLTRRGAARLAVSLWSATVLHATNGGGTFSCSARNRAMVGGSLETVTATKRSWLVVRSKAGAAAASRGELGAYRGDWRGSWVVRPGKSLTKLLPPGRYNLTADLFSVTSMAGSVTSGSQSDSVSLRGRVELLPVGTRRRHSGKGLKFTRARHRSCTHNSVRVKLTRKARKRAKRITISVNGQRRRVLVGSALRHKAVTLRRIPRRSNGAIRAVVVTKSGSQRVMRSTSWPCA